LLQDWNKAGPIDPTRVIISRVVAARDVRGNFNTVAMAMAAAWAWTRRYSAVKVAESASKSWRHVVEMEHRRRRCNGQAGFF
jgi:hypothetical protein